MINRLVYRRNKKLLKLAKETFGDKLILNAWISTWINEENPYGTKSEAAKRISNKEEMNSFEFEDVLVLEFSNGRKVAFSASENGSCDAYKENIVLEEI